MPTHETEFEYIKDQLILRIERSGIDGVGVFALVDIPKDKMIFREYGNQVVKRALLTEEEFSSLPIAQQEMFITYYFKFNNKRQIKLYPGEGRIMNRYTKYAEENFNCVYDSEMNVITTREIKAGEEVIMNANTPIETPPFSN